jgi:hypothetical protein
MQIRNYLTAIVGASALAMAMTAAQAQAASDTGSSSANTGSSSSGMMMKHGKSGAHSVSGQVKSVSEDSLTVRNRAGQDRTLALGSDTKYLEHGKQISRSDVTEGSHVRAIFTGSGENLHATEIRIFRTSQAESKKFTTDDQSSSNSGGSPSNDTGGGTPAAGTSGTGSSDVTGGGAGAKPNSDLAKPDASDMAKPDTATGGTGSSDGGY